MLLDQKSPQENTIERRLRTFFDFIEFQIEVKEIDKRCNNFAEKGQRGYYMDNKPNNSIFTIPKTKSREQRDNCSQDTKKFCKIPKSILR